jgi:hypothetical protein
MNELKFEIKKNITVLSESTKGWKKEVNVISWNGRKPKLDIRDWDDGHKMMGKGITLSREEFIELKKVLSETDIDAFLE